LALGGGQHQERADFKLIAETAATICQALRLRGTVHVQRAGFLFFSLLQDAVLNGGSVEDVLIVYTDDNPNCI
jgi:hypothetical protein